MQQIVTILFRALNKINPVVTQLHDLEVRTTNWFGVYSLLRIYKHYVYLDTDANGMLSPKEFLKFGICIF